MTRKELELKVIELVELDTKNTQDITLLQDELKQLALRVDLIENK